MQRVRTLWLSKQMCKKQINTQRRSTPVHRSASGVRTRHAVSTPPRARAPHPSTTRYCAVVAAAWAASTMAVSLRIRSSSSSKTLTLASTFLA